MCVFLLDLGLEVLNKSTFIKKYQNLSADLTAGSFKSSESPTVGPKQVNIITQYIYCALACSLS